MKLIQFRCHCREYSAEPSLLRIDAYILTKPMPVNKSTGPVGHQEAVELPTNLERSAVELPVARQAVELAGEASDPPPKKDSLTRKITKAFRIPRKPVSTRSKRSSSTSTESFHAVSAFQKETQDDDIPLPAELESPSIMTLLEQKDMDILCTTKETHMTDDLHSLDSSSFDAVETEPRRAPSINQVSPLSEVESHINEPPEQMVSRSSTFATISTDESGDTGPEPESPITPVGVPESLFVQSEGFNIISPFEYDVDSFLRTYSNSSIDTVLNQPNAITDDFGGFLPRTGSQYVEGFDSFLEVENIHLGSKAKEFEGVPTTLVGALVSEQEMPGWLQVAESADADVLNRSNFTIGDVDTNVFSLSGPLFDGDSGMIAPSTHQLSVSDQAKPFPPLWPASTQTMVKITPDGEPQVQLERQELELSHQSSLSVRKRKRSPSLTPVVTVDLRPGFISCEDCGRKFVTTEGAAGRRARHQKRSCHGKTGEKPRSPCTVCGETYARPDGLLAHQRDRHPTLVLKERRKYRRTREVAQGPRE
ncbi:hypothetical protein NA57DRAFT_51961 [Rhizodiscina lignyota]|uniref:C2H2-type domain-containing protein n=1 Tax=Rhizodiscina lignyota TaxID=1504668 RepID=A0A9P4IMX0_9PEZI|nr:hypothetical protein NA57DRAFT_51961 [Rhizodiscina lignyota]